MRFAFIVAIALTFGLASCGFSPLYAPSAAGGGPAIGPVIVDEVPGKAGFELKAELDKLFDAERGAGAARRLQITMTESVIGVGYRVNESASRSDVILSARYVLFDVAGAQVVNGNATSTASFDVPDSAYGQVAGQNDARVRAAQQLAEVIRAQLALKLAAKKKAG